MIYHTDDHIAPTLNLYHVTYVQLGKLRTVSLDIPGRLAEIQDPNRNVTTYIACENIPEAIRAIDNEVVSIEYLGRVKLPGFTFANMRNKVERELDKRDKEAPDA